MMNPQPIPEKTSPYNPANRPNRSGAPAKSQSIQSLETSKRRSGIRLFFVMLGIVALAFGTYAFAEYSMFKKDITVEHEGAYAAILDYSADKDVNPDLFKKPGAGRFNVVLMGMGGENHPGGNLTDSIQIISIDTINKQVGITSVPRDLNVKVTGYGETKINEAYSIGERKKAGGGGYLVRETLEKVIGAPISNFVAVDFTAAKDVIDQLGGIDINVPKAINDPLYPDERQVGYSPFSIKAGLQHMNGATALKYARSRETTSDFDRSARQQLIIQAMKDKALSLGVLTNPVKINNIMSTLGKHVKTDLTTEQIRTLVALYKDSGNAHTAVLDTSDRLGLLKSGQDSKGRYISYPVLGLSDYTAIWQWFNKNNPDPLIGKEGATVTVAASSSVSEKELESFATRLEDYGFKVEQSLTPYSGYAKSTQLYQASTSKKVSANYLSSILDTDIQDDNPLDSGSDFEIIYVPQNSSTKKK